MLRIEQRLIQQREQLRQNVDAVQNRIAEIRKEISNQRERDQKDLDFQAMLRDETNIKGRGELGNHIKSNIHTLIWLSYPFNL